MKAVVLAAGYATRLRPYTESYPKSLLRVAGWPLLDNTISRLLTASDIDGVYLVTNHLYYAAFQEWRRRSVALIGARLPVEIVDDGTTSNEDRLGSIGDLLFVADEVGLDDDALVVCSDKMFAFDIQTFCRHAARVGGVVNTYENVGDPSLLAGRYGCLSLGPGDRVIDFEEKPAKPNAANKSIAFYIYPRDVMPMIREYLGSGDNPDAPGYLSQWLCRRTPMFGWPIDGECLDVGSSESYRQVNAVCWEREKGVPFGEIRPFVDASVGEADLDSVLSSLEAEPRVTLITVGVSADRVEALSQRLREQPLLVPVNVVTRSREPAETQARACDANVVVVAAPGSRDFDLSVVDVGDGPGSIPVLGA